MGHLAGKDLYREVGRKIDNQHLHVPWNDTLYKIVKELFSEKEAGVFVSMPHMFSDIRRISQITRMNEAELQPILEKLADKGLIMDFFIKGKYRYMPSPMAVGLFEFTMMRTDGEVDMKLISHLFHDYMDDGAFYRANFDGTKKISIARALPHEESLADYVEILDYERVNHVIETTDTYAIGLCSCRHKKDHTGHRGCDTPVETCTSFGSAAEHLVRHNMARKISESELREVFARSRELGLVFAADNVQKGVAFICQCCGCCCSILEGLNKHGLTDSMVTSTFIAQADSQECNGCGRPARSTPLK